ncbi:MAG: hypothetical protein IRZ15_08465 [Bryobacteraceae bacterium]|nr:hypothetical protein [Bryobacteraceae bacterium]
MLTVPAGASSDPPPDLARRVARKESQSRKARDHYTYRQAVLVEEFPGPGSRGGHYREVRDIIFSPEGQRSEKVIGRVTSNLNRLRLTEEDFRDIREVQPFLFVEEHLWAYTTRFRGEASIDGEDCWLLEVRPRQIFDGQRLFDGMLWISKRDEAVVRSEGKAVPDIINSKTENLFPRFTTIRRRIDNEHWFPVYTYADDTLPFRSGPIRMRMKIEYSSYKRFEANSTIEFKQAEPDP